MSGTAAWAGKKVYRVFSPSRDSFGAGTKNLVESGHGIDTETFRPSDSKPGSERFELLSVSRISKVKEFNVLVDAVAVLVNVRIPGIAITCSSASRSRIPGKAIAHRSVDV